MQLFKTWRGLSSYIIRQSLQGWLLPTQNLSQWKAEYDGFMNALPPNGLYGISKTIKEKSSDGSVFNRFTEGRRMMRPLS